ncbi:hypothetical protein MVES_003772 [Malassezia vespertilionis]|uniref:Uncharacterized protein n=2 Tax=Malassezia vespertilionis TaxID=2020962 RepID=A0A2N1J6V5_9BASI|nr:hypothetical protein MVES_003772 [Malassezia vespertilionis]
MWQTIVAFRTSLGKGFNRVLDGGFTLANARRMVGEKYELAAGTNIHLSYEAADGTRIDLEDNEDFRAFHVHASRESTATIFVDAQASSVGSAPDAAEGVPSKNRGRRGRGVSKHMEAAPEPVDPPIEEIPVESTSSGPQKNAKKTKKHTEPTREPEPESAPQETTTALQPSTDQDDDDAPLSSQTAHTESQHEKAKRPRRTKAEMEAFRAEKSTKKAEKASERANKVNGTVTTPVAEAEADTTAAIGDETTIAHDSRNEEHVAAASTAVQALIAQGKEAIDERLNELKGKKQRKNATEREEQKMLVRIIKGTPSAPPSEVDVFSRKFTAHSKNACSPMADERNLDKRSLTQPAHDASTSAADASASDDSREYFSQPESHAGIYNQVQGPAPRPMESTPQRMRDSSADSRRSMSGAFAKLSELRPSALRRTFSQQDNAAGSTSAAEVSADIGVRDDASDDEDESSETETSSSDDDASASVPLTKMAGAGAKASAAGASREKLKRSFFSALS